MTTDDNSAHKSNTNDALKNNVPHSQAIKQENTNKDIGKPVNNGGVATAKYDLHLEKQWMAVKDEYLANFPETENYDSTKEDSLEALISNIAKKRKKSPQEIHNEIMNWSPKS